MKAVPLWQPWASAIAAGLKKVETRHWSTKHRGRLAIAATKNTPGGEDDFFEGLDHFEAAAFAQIGIGTKADLPRGAIVCTCDLIDCVLMTPALIASTSALEKEWGLWEVGRYAWLLDNVVWLKQPIPVRCGRSLWDWKEAA